MSAAFNADELDLLSNDTQLTVHPVVSIVGRLPSGGALLAADAHVAEGTSVTSQDLVQPPGTLGDLALLRSGNGFLTQFHNDLGALLDSQLTALGDQRSITRQFAGPNRGALLRGLGSDRTAVGLAGCDFPRPGIAVPRRPWWPIALVQSANPSVSQFVAAGLRGRVAAMWKSS